MARKKEYIEEEVVDKAMKLFWRNGYEATSMHMLEKEMGINKFSIYSSFGSKEGLFRESLKSYQGKVDHIFEKLKNGSGGIDDIKTFFYDSVRISQLEGNQKGCLLTSTYQEFADRGEEDIHQQMNRLMKGLKEIFMNKLRTDKTKNKATIMKQANYLLLAKHGLATACRVNSKQEIEDYIEMTFQQL